MYLFSHSPPPSSAHACLESSRCDYLCIEDAGRAKCECPLFRESLTDGKCAGKTVRSVEVAIALHAIACLVLISWVCMSVCM